MDAAKTMVDSNNQQRPKTKLHSLLNHIICYN